MTGASRLRFLVEASQQYIAAAEQHGLFKEPYDEAVHKNSYKSKLYE